MQLKYLQDIIGLEIKGTEALSREQQVYYEIAKYRFKESSSTTGINMNYLWQFMARLKILTRSRAKAQNAKKESPSVHDY